jgi:hypothetical protein
MYFVVPASLARLTISTSRLSQYNSLLDPSKLPRHLAIPQIPRPNSQEPQIHGSLSANRTEFELEVKVACDSFCTLPTLQQSTLVGQRLQRGRGYTQRVSDRLKPRSAHHEFQRGRCEALCQSTYNHMFFSVVFTTQDLVV